MACIICGFRTNPSTHRREKRDREREVASLRCHLREKQVSASPASWPPGQPGPTPDRSPGFPLAVDEKVVEEEEGSLLDIARRDFQQGPLKEQLGADVREVGTLRAMGGGE